jgi:nucleotide-binding universal stress UspA family protein
MPRSMFEKVLVPTDFSKYASKVVECAAEIPGVKKVVLLNVISMDPLARVWDPVAEVKDAEKKLMELGKTLKPSGIEVKVKAVSVLEGEVAGAIEKVAEEEKVQLVYMGARGKSLIESVLLGSVSKNVLRFGNNNLLIMRYKAVEGAAEMEKFCARIFAKVLFPTDFSEPAGAALSFLGTIQGIGEIVILHVVHKGETKQEIDASLAKAKNMVEEISKKISPGGTKISSRVEVGHPVEVIRDVAKEEDVSLVAMSSQGAEAIKRGHIGSTAYEVANSSDRPVLILRRSKIAMYFV